MHAAHTLTHTSFVCIRTYAYLTVTDIKIMAYNPSEAKYNL